MGSGGCGQALFYCTAHQGGATVSFCGLCPCSTPDTNAGSSPPLPRCANREPSPRAKKAPQSEIRSLSVPVRGSPLIHIQPYTSTATLSLTFVSPQKGISSLHSYLAQVMYPSSQSATCHLSRCLISFREYSVCFPRRLLGFEMLWLQHFL